MESIREITSCPATGRSGVICLSTIPREVSIAIAVESSLTLKDESTPIADRVYNDSSVKGAHEVTRRESKSNRP